MNESASVKNPMNPRISQQNPAVLVHTAISSISLLKECDGYNKLPIKYSNDEDFLVLYPGITDELRSEDVFLNALCYIRSGMLQNATTPIKKCSI